MSFYGNNSRRLKNLSVILTFFCSYCFVLILLKNKKGKNARKAKRTRISNANFSLENLQNETSRMFI